MNRRKFLTRLLAPVVILGTPLAASADDREQTAIYIGDMHCKDCARKIAGKLYTVPGVAGVRAIFKSGHAYVTHQTGKNPSPRAMWEAVESVNFKPIRMAGPGGVFEEKPRF